MPKPPPSSSPFWKLVTAVAGLNVRLYRLTGGRVGGRLKQAPILLLHHVGRKSGTARVTPVVYLPDGDDLVIVASKAGADKHPAWFHNLMAAPETTVEVRRERRRVRPRLATDDERERFWPRLVASYPPFVEYEGYTDRRIPLVVLERA